MAITANEIYQRAIALIDEINPETGVVDVDTTQDYLARTPFLLSTLQTELMTYSSTRNKHEIVCDGSGDGWLIENLPIDVMSIDDVVIDGIGYVKNPIWKTERNENITEFYYDGSFEGTIRIIYVPIPTPITDLAETLTIDDATANLMVYGLAEAFINVEQNDFLQKIFKQKYDEQKRIALQRKPMGMVKVKNAYGRI